MQPAFPSDAANTGQEMSAPNRPKARSDVQIDNERVIVTRWSFSPGAETGWHRHAYDYVVVPLADGKLALESAQGTHESRLRCGESYFRQAGVEHNVINANDCDYAFVEIEFKD